MIQYIMPISTTEQFEKYIKHCTQNDLEVLNFDNFQEFMRPEYIIDRSVCWGVYQFFYTWYQERLENDEQVD